ncbi:histidine kinase [Sphingobacterium sp. ML3W]|uniref:sensor histidine kinase n=1 Tax=Sphingobacterium sp. ML3W TaxID=1538644 RepID=UPI00249BE6F3|nr:histidine kinase [Sphingobacterium sp. ML3W]WFA81222.1 histidine kinase [Sphingobacterium sp. ML3W]
MKLYRTGAFYCLIVILLLIQLFSCHQNKPQDAQKVTVVANDSLDLSYENVMLSYLSTQDFRSAALVNKKRNELLKDGYFEHSSYSSILLAYEYLLDDNIDSVEIALKNLEGQKLSSDLAVLKDYLEIRANFSFHDVTSGTMMEQIIDSKEYALAHESVFTFLFYNLLANAEYRQAKYREALKDVESWYHYHPNKSNAHVSQAYQEMKFMQYIALHDYEKLKGTLDSCKHYANATKDSAIIMRMYDLQSQYYFSINNNPKAIEASKKYFNYLEASNTLNAYIFANLGKNFLNNNQVDSAIFYFNAGLRFIKKHKIKHNKMFYYKNLQLAYASKGDYERAYFALDSTFQDYQLSTQRIEAEKINDINTKYQTEKKDQAITLLRTTNTFNHKILVQQRWIFVILFALVFSIAFFIYFRNKQKLLQNINQRILAENRQLILEQKTRQNQLNPHFIYNAIANLQGLISSEQKAKANQYLLLLSRQIRDILELNREEYISLDQEIKSLNNYILLQQMRYQDVFGFQIETEDLDLDDVMIPPMIIQPFVENAIEHAFKNLPYMGQLEISFRTHENQLHVSICDNGWGMQVSKEQVPHKTSLSQIITKERLELLFVDAEPEARIEITPNYRDDLRGYKVEIYIPLVLYFN